MDSTKFPAQQNLRGHYEVTGLYEVFVLFLHICCVALFIRRRFITYSQVIYQTRNS